MKKIFNRIVRIFPHIPFIWMCIAVALCLMGSMGCASRAPVAEKLYWIAPTTLPSVSPGMRSSGFWIGRLDAPDRVILNSDGIWDLNKDIRERLGLVRNMAGFPDFLDGREVVSDIRQWLVRFRDRGRYYGADGHPAGSGFYEKLEWEMGLGAIGSRVAVKWGVLTANVNQRLLPTKVPLYKTAGDIDFDRLQNNGLDIGTPVLVLHESVDGQWLWVRGPASDGWVPADVVGVCSRERLVEIRRAPYVTVVRGRAGLFRDEALTRFVGFARMGGRFLLGEASRSGVVGVMLPSRGKGGELEFRKGYIKAGEVVRGSLAYTPRHIIEQAFEMLDAPYGWGGANVDQDCSQFIQMVFATVGIELPRNSAAQAQVGRELAVFGAGDSERKRREVVVSSGVAGGSILYSKGHVMLYLGEVAGRPYAIHAFWGYREPGESGDRIRVTNRVVVTDLALGRGTGRGSLLSQLKSIRGIF